MHKESVLTKNKLNIIATILTLIGTSCAVNPIGPKVKSRTDIKESNQKSGNPESLNQKYQEETKVYKIRSTYQEVKRSEK